MNIKEQISKSGFFQWQVAEVLGIHETTLCRHLRRPEKLDPAVVKKIEAAIEKLQVEKVGETDER